MKEKLIKNYINSLSKEDINNFALNNNITLTDKEINYLYKIIQKNWYKIIFGDPTVIFNDLKTYFSETKYNQLYQLYQIYKDKYSHYL